MPDLMALVAEAPDAELQQIKDWLELKFAREERGFSDGEEEVWRMLTRVLESRGARHLPPLPVFVKLQRVGRRRYSQAADTAQTFVDKACGLAPLRRIEREEVLYQCFECLASWLHGRKSPVTPQSMILNMAMLSHAVDQAFPGYADAQMLHQIVMLRARR